MALRESERSAVHLAAGFHFGAGLRLGSTFFFGDGAPLGVGADLTLPMGSVVFDDLRFRVQADYAVFRRGGFVVSVHATPVVRTYHAKLVDILSIGTDAGCTAGYYCTAWSFAGTVGFDAAIVSRFSHSDLMKRMYPGVRDGWYSATGGHSHIGIEASKTIGEQYSVSLLSGMTNARGQDENALVPFYLEAGIEMRF